jgi:hypothetical protein
MSTFARLKKGALLWSMAKDGARTGNNWNLEEPQIQDSTIFREIVHNANCQD